MSLARRTASASALAPSVWRQSAGANGLKIRPRDPRPKTPNSRWLQVAGTIASSGKRPSASCISKPLGSQSVHWHATVGRSSFGIGAAATEASAASCRGSRNKAVTWRRHGPAATRRPAYHSRASEPTAGVVGRRSTPLAARLPAAASPKPSAGRRSECETSPSEHWRQRRQNATPADCSRPRRLTRAAKPRAGRCSPRHPSPNRHATVDNGTAPRTV